jgi:hypothetical protein
MLACTCVALIGSPVRVRAAEGQWQAGGRLGVATLDGAGAGPSLEAYLRHGITESLDLDLQVLTSIHPFQSASKSAVAADDGAPQPAWALALAPGVLYRWDVLRTIPYAGVAVGVYEWSGVDRELNRAQFGASARLGVDYLLTRDVFLSAQTSAHFVLADNGVRLPYFQVGVGAGHAWGW